VFPSVSEFDPGYAVIFPDLVESEAAQAQDEGGVAEELQFAVEELAAVLDLLSLRFVLGWGAADHRDDVGIYEFEAVIPVNAICLVRKAGFVEGSVEPIPGAVPGEHPSRSIRTMSCRSEADDQKARFRIPETRDRTSPVFPIPETFYLFLGDLPNVGGKTRAGLAIDDASVDGFKLLSAHG
jgi:hypothetical protein